MLNKIEDKIKEIKEINDDALFSPQAIVALGVVLNTKLVPSVFTFYRLVRSGKLKAVNLGSGDAPRYFVKGKDLKNFLAERYQLEII